MPQPHPARICAAGSRRNPGGKPAPLPAPDTGRAPSARSGRLRLARRANEPLSLLLSGSPPPSPAAGNTQPDDIRFQSLYRFRSQVSLELLDRLPVDARRALVGLDPLIRLPDHLLGDLKRLVLLLRLVHPTLPASPVDHQTSQDDPSPSLRPALPGFLTTTRRSARLPRIGTRPLTVSAAWGSPSRRRSNTPASGIGARRSHVPCWRLDQARATFMPDTIWPVNRHPPDLSQGNNWPWFRCRRYAFDTSAVVHSRSPSRSTPDASSAPFPSRSPPRLIHRAACGGLKSLPAGRLRRAIPPSPVQHRNHQRDLLHRNLLSRSRHTVVCVPDNHR